MASQVIFTGQNRAKCCFAGDLLMNRYAVFNGLERPRRIDSNLNVQILGVRQADNPSAAVVVGVGGLGNGWYAWVACYASSIHTRPVAVLDGSGNYTRGNASASPVSINTGLANRSVSVTVPGINQDGINIVLLYRSLVAGTQAAALAGPFFYVAQGANVPTGNVQIVDTTGDAAVGQEVEHDNFPPNAYRYAIAAHGYVFAGGNFPIGSGYTCTVTPGSNLVTVSGDALFDGITGWKFRCTLDNTGGVNGDGLYYVEYVSNNTFRLVNASNVPINYNGSLTGAGHDFTMYLDGFVLRWCKFGEPEAWPLTNIVNFSGDTTGIAQMPNQPLLIVCTDEPAVFVLDLTLTGTYAFKTTRRMLSSVYSASSHYSLVGVEGALRAIDHRMGSIIQISSGGVHSLTDPFVPKVFKFLDDNMDRIKNWHCAYDEREKLFGAFVTFRNSHRVVDFAICQHIISGGWFFNWEKDLLCTGKYVDPVTGEPMTLGGTEGVPPRGAVWGRIWSPNVYDEWLPQGFLRSGTITGVVGNRTIVVDNSALNLFVGADGLRGRWVLVCDERGEYAQVAYIESNTVNTITANSVVNSVSSLNFNPIPQAGWKFYLGLIECRWGPKSYDFGDPEVLKKMWEVWCCVSGHNEADLPFIRLYRGFETGYDSQLTLYERLFLDRTKNQSLVNKASAKLEPVPRWGIAWYDRSYGPTILHSLTFVFTPTQPMIK